MVRQALPGSSGMHAALQHVKSAHIDAIQTQQRQSGWKTARRFSAMQMEHIVNMQLACQSLAQLVAPIIEITRDDQRRIRRYLIAHIFDQRDGLSTASPGEQTEMRTQTMHAPLPGQIDLAMQQPAAFKSMSGNIGVQGLQDRKTAQYRVAMMPRLIYRVLPINGMRPNLSRDEIVLRAFRIVVITLAMQRMLTLHLLQEHDVGIHLAQPLAQLVQHDAAIEIGEALVDIVGGDFQGSHGGYSTQWRGRMSDVPHPPLPLRERVGERGEVKTAGGSPAASH